MSKEITNPVNLINFHKICYYFFFLKLAFKLFYPCCTMQAFQRNCWLVLRMLKFDHFHRHHEMPKLYVWSLWILEEMLCCVVWGYIGCFDVFPVSCVYCIVMVCGVCITFNGLQVGVFLNAPIIITIGVYVYYFIGCGDVRCVYDEFISGCGWVCQWLCIVWVGSLCFMLEVRGRCR